MDPSPRIVRRRRRLLVGLGFLLFVGLGAVLVFASGILDGGERPQTTSTLGETRTVVIPEGFTASDAAKVLEREGVISSATTFLLELRLKGVAERLRPGTYEFAIGEDNADVIAKLERGPAVDYVRLTIPEGLAIDQTAARLDGFEGVTAEDYERLTREPESFIAPAIGGVDTDLRDLEGLLFPSTYFVQAGIDAQALVQLQLDTFAEKTAGLPWEQAEKLGVTPYEIVVIASMIEKEARVAEERAWVSAVIYNRIERGMILGIDATTRFAVKKWTAPLTKSDLASDSPYNTRKAAGIPPGPIASPGVEALRAALEPADVDFLYYVLIDDEGHHFFTASYEEFLRAKDNAPGQ